MKKRIMLTVTVILAVILGALSFAGCASAEKTIEQLELFNSSQNYIVTIYEGWHDWAKTLG